MDQPRPDDPGPSERYHALDALRSGAMLLGLGLHAAVPYARSCPSWWAVEDPSRSVVFDLGVMLIHSFRMQVFFLMAGFFAALTVARRGSPAFARRRAIRVGLPLAVSWVTIAPLTRLVWIYGQQARPGSGVASPSWSLAFDQLRSEGLAAFALLWHLWFLEYLLMFSAAALAMRWIGPRLRLGPVWERATARLAAGLGSQWLPLGAAAPVGLLTLTMDTANVDGVRSAVPQPNLLVYYGVFFAFGWLLHGARAELASLGRWWREFLVVGSLAVFPAVLWLSGAGRPPAMLAAGQVASGLMTCLLTLGIAGLCVERLGRPSSSARYLADASYWLYLVHFPLIVWLGIVLAPTPLPSFVKFALVLGVATPALLASYHTLVRFTPIGRVLNGPRCRAA